MDSIGKRAAYAIRGRCVQERTRLFRELGKLDIPYTNFNSWEGGKNAPNAYYLQKLALAGYDVFWILTGEKHER